MKKNFLAFGLLTASLSVNAQVLMHVGDTGIFYVSSGTLVYSGGGVQTKATGLVDLHGNMMIVGSGGTDVLRTNTAAAGNNPKTDGGNIILRLNKSAPNATDYDAVSYGQLFIDGISQANSTAIIDKEYQTAANGNGSYFQQVALPFFDKELGSLSTELGKTFGTTRFTQNEILKFDNVPAVSRHYTNLTTKTTDASGYYMLGSKNNNLNTSTSLRTLRGRAYASVPVTQTLVNGGNVNFGTGGNNINEYNEKYNTYLQDQFALPNGAWTGNYAKYLYQFGNPFFTNIDLSEIARTEAGGDGNNISIFGIRTTAGTIKTLSNGSTYATGANFVSFDINGVPAGDISSLIIKPMQTFVLKVRNNTSYNLNFNTLRRFKTTPRFVQNAPVAYSVTAKISTPTVKQLGVIALNAAGEELGRAYYVVSPTFTTGHQNNLDNSVQLANGASVIGTFEEDPINGMYDPNYTSAYWLYINEANEVNFFGKAVPLALYSADISTLKFEIREDAVLLPDAQQNLSSGEAFYYKKSSGTMAPISQNMSLPTNGGTEFGLSYGPNSTGVLGTSEIVKVNRNLVVYNEAIDNFVVQFDPNWKTADIQVYDMSGKIVISAKNVKTTQDFIINLSNKITGTYVVIGTNEKSETFTSKIIR